MKHLHTTNRRSLVAPDPLEEQMGSSGIVRKLISEIERVARTDFTVIISGETGSGKELAAREIHRRSRRAQGPFVPIDCGAVQPNLIESELFGHEKDAFTGADHSRTAKFIAASGGTVFLDEIQNLPRRARPANGAIRPRNRLVSLPDERAANGRS